MRARRAGDFQANCTVLTNIDWNKDRSKRGYVHTCKIANFGVILTYPVLELPIKLNPIGFELDSRVQRLYPKTLSHLANNVCAGWWTSRTATVNQNICRCCFHNRVEQACPKVASTVVVMKEREKERDTRKYLQEERKLRDNCCETRKRRSRADISFHRGWFELQDVARNFSNIHQEGTQKCI